MPEDGAEKKEKKKKPTGPPFKVAPEELVDLFNAVRNKYHRTLEQATITVLLARDWQKRQGEQVAGRVVKATPREQCLYGVHGYVVVSEPYWVETMKGADNRDQRRQAEKHVKIVCDHELCHFAWENGKLSIVPAPHEFPAVIKHWGLDAPGIATNPLVKMVREQMQLAFEDLEEQDDDDVTHLEDAAN